MQIQTFNVGMLSTNCYVVNCPETKETIIIDPGFETLHEAKQIFRYLDDSTLKVKFIVNTHGHLDHIRGDKSLKRTVMRNFDRFPEDFMFEITKEEYDFLRSNFGTLKRGKHSNCLNQNLVTSVPILVK